jgi:hypothetical protein
MYEEIEAQFMLAYGEFSKAELSETFLSLSSNISANTVVITSFVSAYLLTAYVLGSRLNSIQKVIVTSLYVVVMLSSLTAFWADLTLATYLSSVLYEEEAKYWFANVVFLSFSAIFCVSLFYMFIARREQDA